MKTIYSLIVTFGGLFLRAFVICKLWGWFIAPFFAVPEIGMAYAIGISTIISLLTQRVTYDDLRGLNDEEWETTATIRFLNSILFPLIALFSGWIAQMFV